MNMFQDLRRFFQLSNQLLFILQSHYNILQGRGRRKSKIGRTCMVFKHFWHALLHCRLSYWPTVDKLFRKIKRRFKRILFVPISTLSPVKVVPRLNASALILRNHALLTPFMKPNLTNSSAKSSDFSPNSTSQVSCRFILSSNFRISVI